jgi:hypothetical protein
MEGGFRLEIDGSRYQLEAGKLRYRCRLNQKWTLPRTVVSRDGFCFSVCAISGGTSISVISDPIHFICVPSSIAIISDSLFMDCGRLFLCAFEFESRVTKFPLRFFRRCGRLRSICLPAGVEEVGDSCFDGCRSLSALTFERGCRPSVFGACAFSNCTGITSFCVPASVRAIGSDCFHGTLSLCVLTFEPESQLSTLGESVFVGCRCLQLISLPAPVQNVTGLTFAGVNPDIIEIDPDSAFLRICGDFLTTFDGGSLIRYLGTEQTDLRLRTMFARWPTVALHTVRRSCV